MLVQCVCECGVAGGCAVPEDEARKVERSRRAFLPDRVWTLFGGCGAPVTALLVTLTLDRSPHSPGGPAQLDAARLLGVSLLAFSVRPCSAVLTSLRGAWRGSSLPPSLPLSWSSSKNSASESNRSGLSLTLLLPGSEPRPGSLTPIYLGTLLACKMGTITKRVNTYSGYMRQALFEALSSKYSLCLHNIFRRLVLLYPYFTDGKTEARRGQKPSSW